jgi:MarR family transcriptional regulator, lower aerobic nicotinate degradation pathway regulator
MLLARVARVYGGRLARALEQFDLRPQEFAVLHQLSGGEALSQRVLGGALRIHPSNLVAVLDRLQDDRLVERQPDPADRRRQLLTLSARGRARLTKAELAANLVAGELFEPLSAAEQERLGSMLDRLATHCCSPGHGKRC